MPMPMSGYASEGREVRQGEVWGMGAKAYAVNKKGWRARQHARRCMPVLHPQSMTAGRWCSGVQGSAVGPERMVPSAEGNRHGGGASVVGVSGSVGHHSGTLLGKKKESVHL